MNTRLSLLSEEKEKLVDKILELEKRLKSLQEKYDVLLKNPTKAPSPPPNKKPDFLKTGKPKGLPPHRWGRKKGHPGCTRPTPSHIDRTVDQTLDCCPTCQGPLNETKDSSSHIQEDIIPAQVEVVRFVHHAYWCTHCHTDVVAPPAPEEVPHGYLGPQALATMSNGERIRHWISPNQRKSSSASWRTPIVWWTDEINCRSLSSPEGFGEPKSGCLNSLPPPIPTKPGSGSARESSCTATASSHSWMCPDSPRTTTRRSVPLNPTSLFETDRSKIAHPPVPGPMACCPVWCKHF